MAVKTYTTLLASNQEPLFNKITQIVLKPPAGYELRDPTNNGTHRGGIDHGGKWPHPVRHHTLMTMNPSSSWHHLL